jgi:DNA-directed RNA polymerase subunit L
VSNQVLLLRKATLPEYTAFLEWFIDHYEQVEFHSYPYNHPIKLGNLQRELNVAREMKPSEILRLQAVLDFKTKEAMVSFRLIFGETNHG